MLQDIHIELKANATQHSGGRRSINKMNENK